ncbi:TetR family transcriptional regulator [Streptomyces sp. NPDC023723]|uniref:TetR/AcrR family transcriptional regulator n=1 Tax=Streptomyces sp. NPDC023723 TaxID=3154323 RepID=UPI00340D4EB2
MAAARLFAVQGIGATGMEQVAEAAPVSKRTLYAHFRTKNDLVIAHLRDLVRSGATLEAVLTCADVAPRERIRRLFDQPAADATLVRGCPFIDAAAEFPDPESAVHSYAREQKLRMVQLIAAVVTELGCREPLALAEQLATLADGAASRAMVLNEADYGRHARAAAEVLLDRALSVEREQG